MQKNPQPSLLPKIYVLNVDDEADLLKLSKVYLEKENARFIVDISLSVKDAVEKMKKVNYDAIISDYQMPDINGLEFLEQLRIQGNNIPFIIFTGRGREEVAIRALNIGANRYIQKGGDPKTQYGVLAQAVMSEVTRRQMEEFVLIQRDLGISLSSSTTLEQALSEILNAALKLEGIIGGGIYVIDKISGGLKLAYTRGLSDDFIQKISYIDETDPRFKLAMKGKPKFGPHKNVVPSVDRPRLKEGILSLGVIPALFKEKVVAVLNVASYTHIKITKHTKNSLEAIASQIGSTINRISAMDALKESQQKLKVSEEKYRSFLENFQGIAFKGYNDYSQDFFLGNVKKITGYTEDDFISGKTVFKDLIHPKDSQRIAKSVKDFHSSSKRSIQRKYRIKDKWGKIHWLQEDIKKIVKKSQRKSGVYGTIQDITAQKRTEEALRESEEKYRLLVENVGEGVAIVDVNENIFFCNKAFGRIYGLPSEELKGKNLSEYVTSKSLELIQKQTKARFKGVSSTYELEIVRPNGEKRQIVVTASPQLNKKGKLVGTFGITSDITERKTMEKIIKNTKEKYQMLVENLQEGVLLEDPEGFITFVNRRIPEILGYPEDEIIGKHWTHAFAAEDLIAVETEIKRYPQKTSRRYEAKIQAKNGHKISIMVTATPIINNTNDIKGTLVVLSDITKSKEREEREDFLFTLLRHDLRNKIHVIIGYLQLLQKSDISKEEKNWVNTAIAASDESFRLMQKVELLMKIEQEKDLQKINLDSLLKNIISKNQTKALEREIKIEYKEISFNVLGGLLLEELFLNLVENSINHADCNKIRISAHEKEGRIVIIVEDDGKGIPMNIRNQLFAQMPKGERSTGLGIGTYIIKKIVENYGGKVTFKDSELGGARFDVTLNKI